MKLGPLPARLLRDRQAQVEWSRTHARRRWVRKPTRVTRERYLRLLAMAEDGTLDDAGALEFARLTRKMPKSVRAQVESRGLALTLPF